MSKMLMIQLQAAPYIGTAYLCGAAKSAGHAFSLHMYKNDKNAIQVIEDEKPDIIGFSCISGMHLDALKVANVIKSKFPLLPIIMGGPHPTFFPDVIEEPAIDMICRGEGEYAIIDLLNALENRRGVQAEGICNLWVKIDGKIIKNPQRPLIDPLDDLPMIDWSCYLGTEVVHSSPVAFPIRGCPYSCTYCFNGAYKELYNGLGKQLRMFSVDRALKEVEAAIAIFAKNPVIFNSDTLGIDAKWLDDFLDGYRRLTNLSFVALLRPEMITGNMVSILAKHRCHMVAIGVESGSPRVRKELLGRMYTNDTLLQAAKRLHGANIPFRTYNIIGIPSETEEEIWETIDINIAMQTDFPRAAIFSPMPGTKLTQIAIENKNLDSAFSFDDLPSTILDRSILKNGLDGDLLKNHLYFFQTMILFPSLRGLLRKLIRIKSNFIFKIWFYCVYVYLHRKSEGRSWLSYIRYVFANRQYR